MKNTSFVKIDSEFEMGEFSKDERERASSMRVIVINEEDIIQVRDTMRNITIVKRRSFEVRKSGSNFEERVSVDAESKGRERTTLRKTERCMDRNRIHSIKEESLLEEERRFKEPEKSRRDFEILQLGQED
jgi:hypothetical protein